MLREGPAFEISRRLNAVDPAVGDALVATMAQDAAAPRHRRARRSRHGLERERLGAAARRRFRRAARRVRHLPASSSSGPSPRDCAPATPCGARTSDLVRVGALKVITDGSLGTRTAACSHAYPGDPAQPRSARGLAREAPRTHDGRDRRRAGVRDPRDRRRRELPRAGRVSPSPVPSARSSTRSSSRTPTSRGSLASASARACSPSTRSTTATSPTRSGRTRPPCRIRCAALADAGANLLFGSDAPVVAAGPVGGDGGGGLPHARRTTRRGGRTRRWMPRPRWRRRPTGARTAGALIEPGARADLALVENDPLGRVRARAAGDDGRRDAPRGSPDPPRLSTGGG